MAYKPRRTIVDDTHPETTKRLGYSQKLLDDALSVLMDSIANNAEEFEYIPNNRPIRIGKTRVVIRDLEIYPAFHVRFYVGRDDKVHLWSIELAPEDDPDILDE
jgi:hypothetical protein